MSQLQKRGVTWITLMMLICTTGSSVARASGEQHLLTGFALAQTCEKEIDDDMTDYGECIGHAIDRVAGQRHVLLGVHFQAWLMADLAARQNSLRASVLRRQHAQGMNKQMRATKITLTEVCKAKQLPCEPIKERLAQKLQ
jgi:hypothetical protein